ncbi:hypothetical protein KQX54_017753 [Cotesia glomerata]|uniref:Uncharacterized protein n=1 Tax=Cotesia glomerata TaxID=32391 RepID=A0AAV7INW7_COTGL|nr:hypothetical protein KQX54_017753 [Cotesia glomerata]
MNIDLYTEHYHIWQKIAEESIFVRREKSAGDIYQRFLELLDGFLVHYNRSDHQKALIEKPHHYSEFTCFLALCKARLAGTF